MGAAGQRPKNGRKVKTMDSLGFLNQLANDQYVCSECDNVPEIKKVDFNKYEIEFKCKVHGEKKMPLKKYIDEQSKYAYYNCICDGDKTRQIDYLDEIFVYCFQCHKKLCKKCLNKDDKTHQAFQIPVNEISSKCNKHNSYFTKFCETCYEQKCNNCEINKSHKIIPKIDKPEGSDIELLKNKKKSLIEQKETIEYLIKLIDMILTSYYNHSFNYFHYINVNNLANSLKIYNKMNNTLEEQIKSNRNNALDYLNKKLKIKLKEAEKELDLSNTNLEPEDFKILSILNLSNIEKINLSSNKLKDMSVLNYLNLSEIKIIDLSNNEIENPEFLKQLSGQAQKLERLYLNNNKIKFREFLTKKFFKYLKEIRLEDNPMTPKEISEIYNSINEQKYSNRFTICYSIDKDEFYNENKIRIFGGIFVNNNEDNCYLIINGQKSKLTQFYNYNEEENELSIILVKTGDMNDLSCMFAHCASLTSLPDISRLDTSNVEDMSSMFLNCKKLVEIDDLSKWDVSKVRSMKCMFFNCQYLSTLPDIEKWDTKALQNSNSMFEGCNINIIPEKFLL